MVKSIDGKRLPKGHPLRNVPDMSYLENDEESKEFLKHSPRNATLEEYASPRKSREVKRR